MYPHDTQNSIDTYKEMKISATNTSIIYKRFLNGAYVNLSIDRHIEKPNPYRNTLNNSIEYTIFLSYLCSAYNLDKRNYNPSPKCQDRAPRGLPRQLLCEMLSDLLQRNKIKLSDNICLNANPSRELVNMYSKMGFITVGHRIAQYDLWKESQSQNISLDQYNIDLNNSETIMITTVDTILNWCRSYYDKKFNMHIKLSRPILYEFEKYFHDMYINISIQKSTYPILNIPFSIKINTLSPLHNPLDFPNKLFCNLLDELLTDNIITENDIILVEVPKHDKNVIVRYLHIGFYLNEQDLYDMKILTIPVVNILQWCSN